MNSAKILVQVNTSFDLYIYTAIVRDSRNRFVADLLAPHGLLAHLPIDIRASYGEVYGFKPRIKNIFSFSAIGETLRLRRWARKSADQYHAVLFGAYRSDITSLLVRYFFKTPALFAIKQGIDIPDVLYKRYFSLRVLHDNLYFRVFGFSSFLRELLVTHGTISRKSDYFFTRVVWKRDPFNKSTNVFTIGTPQGGFEDGSAFLVPDFKLVRNKCYKCPPRGGILIIGERTPMTPGWGGTQDSIFQKICTLLLSASGGERIYVRCRKNLSSSVFYSQLNPIFLDPDQLYDDQLLQLNPRLVISVKSTASKIAAYHGYPSLLLYPCMHFEAAEVRHLDYLFGDGAPLERVSSLEKIPALISESQLKTAADSEFSQRNIDVFFERLNRGNR